MSKKNVLLLGRTGSGKSETGNTLLGRRAFKAQRAFSSVTTVCSLETSETCTVIDTPGVSDTDQDPTVAAKQLADFLCEASITSLDAIIVVVSATERFTQDLTAGVRLMEAALGDGSLAAVGTVLFTRGGELERDGITADELVANGPGGLLDLVSRCGGRLALVENKDGLSTPVDSRTEAHHAPIVEPEGDQWAVRGQRGARVLQAAVRPLGHPYDLSSAQTLDAEALANSTAAAAMQLSAAAQQAVGAHAVSDLTAEKLESQFEDIMAIMQSKGGPAAAKLAERFQQMQHTVSTSRTPPTEFDLATQLPENIETAPGAQPVASGSKLWLAGCVGASLPPKLALKKEISWAAPTVVWAGGSVSKGTHRMQIKGPFTCSGELRFRSPPGVTLCIRGPAVLRGPLRAIVTSTGGDDWLGEGILKCSLAPLADTGAEGGAADIVVDALPRVHCELHGTHAVAEVERAEAEACAVELSATSTLEIGEGGCMFLDGTTGIEPSAGRSNAATMSVEKGGQMELFGLARLELCGATGLRPSPPRILAQVMV